MLPFHYISTFPQRKWKWKSWKHSSTEFRVLKNWVFWKERLQCSPTFSKPSFLRKFHLWVYCRKFCMARTSQLGKGKRTHRHTRLKRRLWSYIWISQMDIFMLSDSWNMTWEFSVTSKISAVPGGRNFYMWPTNESCSFRIIIEIFPWQNINNWNTVQSRLLKKTVWKKQTPSPDYYGTIDIFSRALEFWRG